MILDDLKEEWKKDSVIDESNLSGESLRISSLHSKYLSTLIDAKQKLIKREYDVNVLRKKKTRYYRGEMTKDELKENGWDQYQMNKPLKSELNDILSADDDMIKEMIKIAHLKLIIYFLESVLGSLKNRGFEIKNSITWSQYISGN